MSKIHFKDWYGDQEVNITTDNLLDEVEFIIKDNYQVGISLTREQTKELRDFLNDFLKQQ